MRKAGLLDHAAYENITMRPPGTPKVSHYRKLGHKNMQHYVQRLPQRRELFHCRKGNAPADKRGLQGIFPPVSLRATTHYAPQCRAVCDQTTPEIEGLQRATSCAVAHHARPLFLNRQVSAELRLRQCEAATMIATAA